MFRKMILSTLVAIGTLSGFALSPASAEAHMSADFHHHRFEVLVSCGRGWENRGMYGDRFEAERAARHLRFEGFQVEIREC